MEKIMEKEASEDVGPVEWVQEHLRNEPIGVAPWKICRFFEDETNIKEEYLDKSLDKLAEIFPEFEEKNWKMVEELEKAALLTVPMFRKLQLMTILSMVREATSSTQVFPLLPDFPKPPATNLPNHIFPDSSLSSEQKTLEYEQIAKNTTEVLGHLVSWRDHVVGYCDGLEQFLKEYEEEMSAEQKKHVQTLIGRTRNTIPMIDEKIEEKKIRSQQEIEEFEKFYLVVSKEPKYAQIEPAVAKSQIQKIFDNSDHDLRRIISRIGDSGYRKRSPESGEMTDFGKGIKRKRTAENRRSEPRADPSEQNKQHQRTILVEARADKPISLATLRAGI